LLYIEIEKLEKGSEKLQDSTRTIKSGALSSVLIEFDRFFVFLLFDDILVVSDKMFEPAAPVAKKSIF
jgi:hypothetical protein